MQAQAAAMRADWIEAATDALLPLPPPHSVTAEVRTMCGEAQSLMGIWASYSLMRFLPEARLVVHSDGTLTRATVERWSRVVPGLRIVSREEGAQSAATRLAGFPRVLDWSSSYHFGAKLGPFYSVGATERLIDMDTDTLTLSEPAEMLACLGSDRCKLAWNRDEKSYYAYPAALLQDVLGERIGPLPECLNGGYMVSFKLGDPEWGFLDAVIAALEADPRTDPLRYWMHQTLFALLASTMGEAARALPPGYGVHKGPTRPDTVMRHYVGNPGIRPRFFVEGVPAVVRDARRRGQLPAGFFAAEVPEHQA
jgi:hypothetical protein